MRLESNWRRESICSQRISRFTCESQKPSTISCTVHQVLLLSSTIRNNHLTGLFGGDVLSRLRLQNPVSEHLRNFFLSTAMAPRGPPPLRPPNGGALSTAKERTKEEAARNVSANALPALCRQQRLELMIVSAAGIYFIDGVDNGTDGSSDKLGRWV